MTSRGQFHPIEPPFTLERMKIAIEDCFLGADWPRVKVAKPCGRSPQGAECSRGKHTAQCILAPSTAQGGKPCRGSPQGAECPSVKHCTVYSGQNTAQGGKTPSRYSLGCRREHSTVHSSAKHCTGWKNPVQVLLWVQTAHVWMLCTLTTVAATLSVPYARRNHTAFADAVTTI